MAQLNNNLDYLVGKEVFELSYSEAKKINEFDMVLYKKENPEKVETINYFIASASNDIKEKIFGKLTLTQKEEVLKRMFIETEEKSIEENFEELMEEDQVEEFEID
jgi:hypothetical protein